MKRIILFLAIVAVVAGGILGYMVYDANRDFSEWMSLPELKVYLQQFEAKTPGHPDAWQISHWITGLEGRWHDGIAEFRVRSNGLAPSQWEGYWFFDQDQETFGKTINYYRDQGFTCAYSNSYTLPDGTKHYQSVWHKTGS